jgi:hypothetical protein
VAAQETTSDNGKFHAFFLLFFLLLLSNKSKSFKSTKLFDHQTVS